MFAMSPRMRIAIGQFLFCLALIFSGGEARAQEASAASLAIGEARDGVTDRAMVMAPPHYLYEVERVRGSFVNCGDGLDRRAADANGRDVALLSCGVTLTETMVIPAAAQSARIVVHF